MFHVKEKAAQLVAPDYAQILFDGEKKLKFPLKIDDLITGMRWRPKRSDWPQKRA